MGKRKGSPQIPLSLRQKLAKDDESELIEKRYVSSTPGNTTAVSRKALRKRNRTEKKLRRQAFHAKVTPEEIIAKAAPKKSDKPPKKKPRLQSKPVPEKPRMNKKQKIEPSLSREDEEIKYFEKKLRKSFHAHDQLDDLLDGITAGTEAEFNPNAKILGSDEDFSDDEQQLSDVNEEDEDEDGDGYGDVEDEDGDEDSSEVSQGEDSSEISEETIMPPKREPKAKIQETTDAKQTVQKYVPPSLRKKQTQDLSGVQRRIRGFLNRVSEGNLTVLANEIQQLYEAHARHDLNEHISSCILEDCSADTAQQQTLVPVYAGLIAYLHFTVGMDVGGYFLNYWIEKIAEYEANNSKAAYLNCVKLLGYLYNYEMVQCLLLFDFIRKAIDRFEAQDVEALLTILKITGLELRSDDPRALKDIIVSLQERVQKWEEVNKQNIDEEFGIRVRFILEMIYELKNNKKHHFVSTKAPPNLLLVVKKAKKNSLSGQLQISWAELDESKSTKWWIRGTSMLRTENVTRSTEDFARHNKLLEIARKQGMTTDVRRSIFAAIMGADDFLDAFENILKLELKGKQDREVVNVLVHCCLKEKTFNLFYGYLAVKLCSFDYNHKFTFQYNFWDRFKRLSKEKLPVIMNFAKLLGHMLGNQALSLSIFKVVEFYQLKPLEIVFFRTVFARLFADHSQDLVAQIFERLAMNSALFHVREQLQNFFSHAFKKSSLRNRDLYTEEESVKLTACLKDIKIIFQQAPTGFE